MATRRRWSDTASLTHETIEQGKGVVAIKAEIHHVADSSEIPLYIWVESEHEGWVSEIVGSAQVMIKFNQPIPTNSISRHFALCERFIGKDQDAPNPSCNRKVVIDDQVIKVILHPANEGVAICILAAANNNHMYPSVDEIAGILLEGLLLDTIDRVCQDLHAGGISSLKRDPIGHPQPGTFITTLKFKSDGFRAVAAPIAESLVKYLSLGMR